MTTVIDQLEAAQQDLLDNPPVGGDIDVFHHHDPDEYLNAYRPIHSSADLMDRKIAELKRERRELKEQIRNIEQYDPEDTYEDGTTLVWQYAAYGGGQVHFNAAIRDNGEWYLTGSMRGLNWQQLVVEHLSRAQANGRVSMMPPPSRIEV